MTCGNLLANWSTCGLMNETFLFCNARANLPSLGLSNGVLARGTPTFFTTVGGQQLIFNSSSLGPRGVAKWREEPTTSSRTAVILRCCQQPTPANRKMSGALAMASWTSRTPTPKNWMKQTYCHETLASFTSCNSNAKTLAGNGNTKSLPSGE